MSLFAVAEKIDGIEIKLRSLSYETLKNIEKNKQASIVIYSEKSKVLLDNLLINWNKFLEIYKGEDNNKNLSLFTSLDEKIKGILALRNDILNLRNKKEIIFTVNFETLKINLVKNIEKIEALYNEDSNQCIIIKNNIILSKKYYSEILFLNESILKLKNEELTLLYEKSKDYAISLIIVMIQKFLLEDDEEDSENCINDEDRRELRELINSMKI